MSSGPRITDLPIPDYRYRNDHCMLDKPVEIGSYSATGKNEFVNDKSELLYYVGLARKPSLAAESNAGGSGSASKGSAAEPNAGGSGPASKGSAAKSDAEGSGPLYDGPTECNLREGYDVCIMPENMEDLTTLLKWILLNRERIEFADFIVWRGTLIGVLATPTDWNDNWKIVAARFRGKIYLCEIETDEEAARKAKWTKKDREMAFWGYKFGQCVTSDTADGVPDTTVPLNTGKAFYSVVRTSIKKHNLLFSGEVDCQDINQNSYIKLKTNKELESEKDKANFKRYKLMRCWAQACLLGQDRLICGFRDEGGIVRRIQTFRTPDIPRYCSVEGKWNPNSAFDFCNKFLDYVKDAVKLDYDRAVYIFEKKSKAKAITCRSEDRHKLSNPKYEILPDWYIDEL